MCPNAVYAEDQAANVVLAQTNRRHRLLREGAWLRPKIAFIRYARHAGGPPAAGRRLHLPPHVDAAATAPIF